MIDSHKATAALSSHRHCLTFLTNDACPPTLVGALSTFLGHIVPKTWPTRLSYGGTYLNGVRVLHDIQLKAPCRIEYFEPKEAEAVSQLGSIDLARDQIIFEDEDLLAVFKPPRLSTMPTREQAQHNLWHILQCHLKRADLAASLHMPSRIDTSACGLVLASKSTRMHRALQRVFERRQIQKIYLLRSSTRVEWESISVDLHIGRDPEHPVLRRAYSAPDKSRATKPALTNFRLIRKDDYGSLIEARPVTGRTHQIRVHCSYAGFPIVGDKFYGFEFAEDLNLLSFRAEFAHPLSNKPMAFEVPESLMPAWAKYTHHQ